MKTNDLIWDIGSQKFVPKIGAAGTFSKDTKGKGPWWDKAYYDESLEIARSTGNAMLAVVTIVRNRWQQGKGKPIALGNVALGRLGFDRRAKDSALRKLEKAGFVEVLRVVGSSPKITVLKEF